MAASCPANGQIVRSVLCDKPAQGAERIYVGSFGEFGYWENTVTGKMVYHSLSKGLKFKSTETEEIWHILKAGSLIYFQSFSYLYHYDGNRVTEIQAPGNFMYLRSVGTRRVIQLIDKGLYVLEGGKFQPLAGTEALSKTSVSSILPFDAGRILIATAKHGLFLWEDGNMIPWEVPLATELKKNILNKAICLKNGTYAFGTILNGLYIVSPEGRLLSHFSSQNGLQNNTILALYEDARQNLWLGLNKGLDMISLASPLSFYTQANNPLGTPYAAAVWNDRLYVGSNSGLYVKKWPSGDAFQLVPGLQGQVWELKVLDGQLLCGHSEGTFRITENRIEKISLIPGGWALLPIQVEDKKYLMQGTYTGLHLYQKNNLGLWTYLHRIDKVPLIPIKEIVEDKNGFFWLSHAYKGLYRLQLSNEVTSANEWKEYEAPTESLSEYSVELTPWKGRLALVRNSETIVPLTDRHYLFCLENGYALLDRMSLHVLTTKAVAPLIRKVTSLTNTSISFPTTSRTQIPDQTRSIRISYTLPQYGNEILYQYRLKGLSAAWSDWTVQSFADFTNLTAGAYEFQIKNSLNPLVTTYPFTVLPHWYETGWAKFIFLLAGILSLLALVYWQEKRLATHRKKLLTSTGEKTATARNGSGEKDY